MRAFVVDTNALISFVTDRNVVQQGHIKDILESAAQLKCIVYCPQNAITEFVYVMEKVYQVPQAEIRSMVQDFLDLTGVEIVHELDYKVLFGLWPEHISEFADAIVASMGKMRKGSVITTFDKKLLSALKKLELPYHRFASPRPGT